MPAPARSPTSLPWLLALSHLRRRRNQNLISLLGVAIGVMVLTTALSLTNGFVRALVEATVKAQPHVDLQAWTGGTGAPRDPKLEEHLKADEQVLGWSPYVRALGLLGRRARDGSGGGVGFAQVFGVLPDQAASALRLSPEESALLGALPEGGILLGEELARQLGVAKGDEVVVTAASGANPLDARRRIFRAAGTFRTGNYVIDSGFAFSRLANAQDLTGLEGRVSGYHVGLKDPDGARAEAAALSRVSQFWGRPWQDYNATLISQLALQKLVISIVLLLLVVVAAFGIVNVLLLTVFEKTNEIAILRAMGASRRAVVLTFAIEGLLLGLAGVLLGNLLGLGLSLYFRWRPISIPGDLYFITSLPVDIRAGDFAWVSVAGVLITLLAAYLPARRAAAVQPARIIR